MGKRLRQIRSSLNMTQEALAKEIGIGKSALSMIETGRAALSERNKKILVQILNVSPDWLETGKGEIFQEKRAISIPGLDGDDKVQLVPLYNIQGSHKLSELFGGGDSIVPVNYIYIPNLPSCDGAIKIIGNEMYPVLRSGDIVLYKQMKQVEDIFWGDMYLISVNLDSGEYITVRYVQKSDIPNHIRIVGQNPHHSDRDVDIANIRALALVKASIRMNR